MKRREKRWVGINQQGGAGPVHLHRFKDAPDCGERRDLFMTSAYIVYNRAFSVSVV